MRIDSVLDSVYVLGSLWGALAGPPVCTSSPSLPGAVHEVPQPPISAAVTAFVNVNIVPMDTERVLVNHTVLIEGGQITALGPSGQMKVPTKAVRIDGRGKYLIPGLGDMHVHFISKDSAEVERLLWSWWLANGVTTVRNMDCGSRGVWGVHFRDRAAAGELWSPRIYTSGPLWTIGSHGNLKRMTDLKPDSVATYVARYKAAGYDFVKPYKERMPVFDSVLAAARRVGIPVAGHVPPTVPLERALAAGMRSIEHLTRYPNALRAWGDSGGRCPMADSIRQRAGAIRPCELRGIRLLAEATRRASVWNTPTLVVSHVRGRSATHTRVAGRFIRALHEAGAGLLLGTDSPILGPITPTDELQEFVRTGLTPYQALLTGTRNVAEYFGILDSSGTVTVGKRADLALLNGNPLEDVTHTRQPAGVMVAGRWLSRDDIKRRLAAETPAQTKVP